jgi:membrane protein YdbS with pleckstrin-like domain
MAATEKTLMSLQPSRVLFLRYYAGIVLLLILTFVLWFFNYLVPPLGPISVQTLTLGLTAFFVLLIIVLFLVVEWRRASTRYVVTDFRIIKKHGLIRRNETVVPYRQLERVVVHQGIIDRLLGIGTLVIDTGEDTIRISSVRDPQKVEQAIMSGMQTLQTPTGSR